MNFFQRRKMNALRKKAEKAHILREHENTKENMQAETQAQYQLAEFYKKHRYDKGLPHAEIYYLECYRVIANLGDPRAQYICGERLLSQAKFWDAWSHNPVYAAPIHKKYAAALYEEAFAYLQSADSADYPYAKRLLGMAHIHGWGMPKDINTGYKLVLDSIELEKAWGRATRIFDELKLNSPEFFAALHSYKRE